jgi:hypothetical protein
MLGANVLAHDRTRIKNNAIGFNLQIAQLPENVRQPLWCRMPEAEQIQIPRDAVQLWFPKREEHRSFQDELFPMAGAGQPVEQTLQGEPHQQHVVIFPRFGPALGQSGMD